MSAIHADSMAARLREDGLYEYTGTSHDHPVAGWPEPAKDVRAPIPAQRAGNAYEQVVLNPADDLDDLSNSADIPQLGQFARDCIRKAQNKAEVQP